MSKSVPFDFLWTYFLTRHQSGCSNTFASACQTTVAHTPHTTHINKHWTPTLIQKSLNMYLLLITLEINSSGTAVTGACCYWQTAVAVTNNMRCLSILHCNPPIRLSLSSCFFFFLTFPAASLCLSKLSSPFSFSQVSWEMIPEPKHLSPQQSTETKLHRKELQGRSGQQERMKGRGVYEIKAL